MVFLNVLLLYVLANDLIPLRLLYQVLELRKHRTPATPPPRRRRLLLRLLLLRKGRVVCFVKLKPVRHPAKYRTGGVLRHGVASLMIRDARVGMPEDGRGYEDRRARGEADDELELPQYEVTPQVRVEAT